MKFAASQLVTGNEHSEVVNARAASSCLDRGQRREDGALASTAEAAQTACRGQEGQLCAVEGEEETGPPPHRSMELGSRRGGPDALLSCTASCSSSANCRCRSACCYSHDDVSYSQRAKEQCTSCNNGDLAVSSFGGSSYESRNGMQLRVEGESRCSVQTTSAAKEKTLQVQLTTATRDCGSEVDFGGSQEASNVGQILMLSCCLGPHSFALSALPDCATVFVAPSPLHFVRHVLCFLSLLSTQYAPVLRASTDDAAGAQSPPAFGLPIGRVGDEHAAGAAGVSVAPATPRKFFIRLCSSSVRSSSKINSSRSKGFAAGKCGGQRSCSELHEAQRRHARSTTRARAAATAADSDDDPAAAAAAAEEEKRLLATATLAEAARPPPRRLVAKCISHENHEPWKASVSYAVR
ncbi:hypothetical protein ACSSS7_005698 [Eimeria intestinalis]